MVIIGELVKTVQYQAIPRPIKAKHAFLQNPQGMCIPRVPETLLCCKPEWGYCHET